MENSYSSFQELPNEDHEELLKLSLSIGSTSHPPRANFSPTGQHLMPSMQFFSTVAPPPPHPPTPPPLPPPLHEDQVMAPFRPSRTRRSPAQTLRQGKSETVPAPYPWATTRRATVHSIEYLLSNGLNVISGEVQCKRCEHQYEIEYDLREKFMEVASFISKNKESMHHRAPSAWMNPTLPNCKFCSQSNCVKPIILKKRSINWLFLLMGQMLGCCKLSELKYFCKHTKNHRTGAKDRVLYLAYLGLCKQLDPGGPFDV